MVKNFFKAKRPWSEYKDLILGYYLDPYLPKVNTLGKPILIVDGFAGPGQFEDGKPGSPLIICSIVEKWRQKGMDIRAAFIEASDENFPQLQKNLQPYSGFATPRRGSFEEHLPELEKLAQKNTVFLYVDPYAVRSLDFQAMQRVYQQIGKAGASVEVLINFNVPIFFRWALAALKRHGQEILTEVPKEVDEEVYGADEADDPVEIATLNSIAGGDYWQAIASDSRLGFIEKLESFRSQYLQRMVSCFKWAGSYDVKAKYDHAVPKYTMVYATRSDHGIELMNDAMCKARREFVKDQFPQEECLFDPTPRGEVVDIAELSQMILRLAPQGKRFTRRVLRIEGLKNAFGRYSTGDFNKAVGELIKAGKMFSQSGRSRVNDEALLSLCPFTST